MAPRAPRRAAWPRLRSGRRTAHPARHSAPRAACPWCPPCSRGSAGGGAPLGGCRRTPPGGCRPRKSRRPRQSRAGSRARTSSPAGPGRPGWGFVAAGALEAVDGGGAVPGAGSRRCPLAMGSAQVGAGGGQGRTVQRLGSRLCFGAPGCRLHSLRRRQPVPPGPSPDLNPPCGCRLATPEPSTGQRCGCPGAQARPLQCCRTQGSTQWRGPSCRQLGSHQRSTSRKRCLRWGRGKGGCECAWGGGGGKIRGRVGKLRSHSPRLAAAATQAFAIASGSSSPAAFPLCRSSRMPVHPLRPPWPPWPPWPPCPHQ